MDFRPTLMSPPSWIFCQNVKRIMFRVEKSMRNDILLSYPLIAHGMTIGTSLLSELLILIGVTICLLGSFLKYAKIG
jgi:hypothetical protein